MEFTFIVGPCAGGKTRRIHELIHQGPGAEKERKILYLCPEQMTMKNQKDLMSSLEGGSMMGISSGGEGGTEVLSFRRLAFRVLEEMGTEERVLLDDVGKSMLIVRILREHEDELGFYRRSVRQKGFVGQLKIMITELIQYGVSPDELSSLREALPETGILRAKLKDVEVIYRAFLENTGTVEHPEQGPLASEAILDLLAARISKSSLLKNAEIYIDDFNGFTPQQYDIIRELLRTASKVYISLSISREAFAKAEQAKRWQALPRSLFFTPQKTVCKLRDLLAEEGLSYEVLWCENEERPAELVHVSKHLCEFENAPYAGAAERVKCFVAEDPKAEVRRVMAEILHLVREEGMDYRDIGVLVCSLADYGALIRRMASLYEIPVFLNLKRDISLNPYVQYIAALGELLTGDFAREAFVRFLKTGLTDVDNETAFAYETLMIAENITGRKRILDSLKEQENQALKALGEELEALRESTRSGHSIQEIVAAFEDFIRKQKVEERLLHKSDWLLEQGRLEEAGEFARIYEEIGRVFTQMESTVGEEKVTIREFTEIWEIGIQACRLGQLPPTVDDVTIGELGVSTLSSVKALFVLGLRSDTFPVAGGNTGLLTEDERLRMGERMELAQGEKERLCEQYYALYQAMGKAQEFLCFSGTLADLSGGSKSLSPLFKRFDEVLGENPQLPKMDPIQLPKPMLYDGKVSSGMKERIGQRIPSYHKLVAFMKQAEAYQDEPVLLSPLIASHLTNPKSRLLSITQLETYANCPFMYYLTYGLRAKERTEPTVRALENGNVLHDLLKEAGSFLSAPMTFERADEIAEELAEKKQDEFSVYQTNGRYKYYWNQLKQTAARAFYLISRQAGLTGFKHSFFEWSFGDAPEDQAGPLEISLSDGETIKIRGKIDRIDLLDTENERYIEIIDYKSGKTTIDPKLLYTGLSLQLPVYLEAGARALDAKPAGFFYFHLTPEFVKPDGGVDPSEEERDDMLMKQAQLDGIFTADQQVLEAMDHVFAEEGKGKVINATRTKSGSLYAKDKAATAQDFDAIENLTHLKIRQAAEKIAGGEMSRSPMQTDSNSAACSYCPYKSACRFENGLGGDEYRRLEVPFDGFPDFLNQIKNL